MAIKILLVIPNLDYGGASSQLALLATGLPRSECELQVCTLGPGGPVADRLRSVGIKVVELGWRRWLDLPALRRVSNEVESFAPNVIHIWCQWALRVLGFARRGSIPFIASSVLPDNRRGYLQSWLERQMLRRAAYIVTSSAAELRRGERLGFAGERLLLIPPGVRAGPVARPEAGAFSSFGFGPGERLILCVGPLEPYKGFYEAIWAFDILHYLYDNLHLVLVGAGPDRERLEHFVHQIQGQAAVHFAGPQAELQPMLARADVVWVPSRTGGGMNVALEAMAAGRPVIASGLAELAEIVRDGIDGLLTPPGDKVALARQTRLLIDDPARGRKMGEAGRARVAQEFSPERLVAQHMTLYERAVNDG